jgi:hypothetical protein
MASSDARPVPKKNIAYRHYFAIRKNDGTLITTWAGQDTELSADGAAFADATNEATEIGTSGIGYIELTSGEMNYDAVIVKTTVTNTDALPYVVTLFPEEDGDIRVDIQQVDGDSTAAANLNSACDNYSATRGLAGTALPDAAADAAGGLPISDAGGLDLDAKIGALTFTVAGDVDVNVQSWKGSAAPDNTGDAYARLGAPAGASVSSDVASVKSDTAAVLADTNELQTDWTDGGRLDLLLDATKAKTDGLNFTGTDVKATLDGEEVTPTAASKTGYTLVAGTGLGNQTADITGTITTVTTVTNGVTLANGAHGGAAASFAFGGGGTISNAAGSALTLTSSGGNGHGLLAQGNGSGSGLAGSGGATGHGLYVVGDTDGHGIYAVGGDSLLGTTAGIYVTSNALSNPRGFYADNGAVITSNIGDALLISSTGGDGDGIEIVGNGTGYTINFGGSAAGYMLADADSGNTYVARTGADGDTLETLSDQHDTTQTYLSTNLGANAANASAVPWNAAWDAEVQSEVQDAIEENNLDHLLKVADADDVVDNSVIAKLAAKSFGTADWSTYSNTTDSLEALRDRGDQAWLTGSGATASASYTTTSWTRTVGDDDGGAGSDTTTVNGTYFSTGETSANPGIVVDGVFTITDGERAVSVDVWGFYNGGGSHFIQVQAYNYTDSTWEPIGVMGLGSTVQKYSWPLAPNNTDAVNDQVSIRFQHSDVSGVVTHVFSLDKVEVNTAVPVVSLTASEIVDEWETQSALDPTGFKVNVMEVGGTGQTANDNGADINTILSRVVGTLAAGTHTAQSGDAYAYLGTNLGANGAAATEAGGTGDHLTAVNPAAVLAAMQANGTYLYTLYTDWINGGRLDNLLDSVSAEAIADAVWDEAIADHATAGSTGAELADAGGTGASAAELWAYGTRTLTTPASQLADAFSGDTITCHRGDELTVSFSGLGSIAGRLALWITAKRDRLHTDAQALIQCTEAAGLVVLNGATATTAADGDITVTDEDAGDITWTVKADATAVLKILSDGAYDMQWEDADGDIHTLSDGIFKVTLDVTRAT